MSEYTKKILVPASGPSGAKVMLVGEAPVEEEEIRGRPFCGAAGAELDGGLRDGGLLRQEVYVSNVLKYRPENNYLPYFVQEIKKKIGIPPGYIEWRGKAVKPWVPEHVDLLYREIKECNPNVIVPMGNLALWALTGQEGILSWRGSEMEGYVLRQDGKPYKVIPTIHPAAVLRNYPWHFLMVQDFRRVAREAKTPDIYKPDWNFVVRPSFTTTMDFLHSLLHRLDAGPLKIVMDIETRKKKFIACIGLGISRKHAICIPFMCVENAAGYWKQLEEELAVVQALKRVITHPNTKLVNQNILYDLQYTGKALGMLKEPFQDTMVTFHTLLPGLEKNLGFISSLLSEHHLYWKDDGKEWAPGLGEDQLWIYNCTDCVRTYEISDSLENLKKVMKQEEQEKFQTELMWPVFKMMSRGVRIDEEVREQFSKELTDAITERDKYVEYLVGHPLNPRSAPQMHAFFYIDMHVPEVIDPKTKRPTLNDEALDIVETREPLLKPVIRAIKETRSLGIYRSNFVEAERDEDRRMRCSFNTAGAETFRFSSSKDAFGFGANLQTVPKGSDGKVALFCKLNGPQRVSDLIIKMGISQENLPKFYDSLDKAEDDGQIYIEGKGETAIVSYRLLLPNVRKMFVPDPGYVIMDWDLERADLFVVVWEADDEILRQAMREGVDIHSMNASDLHITRQLAKNWVHGTDYGCSARTAARKFGLTVHLAEQMRRRWFQIHPGILEWHKRTEALLKTTRSVSNAFGYRRFYFDRVDSILPEALAWTPQSTVAIVINTALKNIDAHLPKVELLLQVHDSLVMQVPEETYPNIAKPISKEMQIVVPYPKPLVIPVSGKASKVSWGDCEDIKMAA